MQGQIRILLIDDDMDIGIPVRVSIAPYELEQAFTGKEGMEKLNTSHFDLCLVDINLPDRDGFQLSEEISKSNRFKNLPIIILSERSESPDVIYGLNSGADDYITKPFNTQELLSRINARLRRKRADVTRVFECDLLEFDCDFQTCKIISSTEKVDIGLTAAEFRILLHLVQNPKKVYSRRDLVKLVSLSDNQVLELRGMNTHIARIRKKLKSFSNRILTIRGKGYSYRYESKK